MREWYLKVLLKFYLIKNYYLLIIYRYFKFHFRKDVISFINYHILKRDELCEPDEDGWIPICFPPGGDEDARDPYQEDCFQIVPKEKENFFSDKLNHYISGRNISSIQLGEFCKINEKRLAEFMGITRELPPNKKAVRYPSKLTAFALCIGLKISLDEAQKFLSFADFTFDRTNKYDNIIIFCLKYGLYEKKTINALLKEYNQMLPWDEALNQQS